MARKALLRMLFLVALAGVTGAQDDAPKPPAAANSGDDWIYFDSRETPRPPRLEIRRNGRVESIAAAADTVLISYLSERAYGALTRLSIVLNDSNRVLLRFEVPEKGVEKAELVLALGVSQRAPSSPFAVALHRVTGKWDDRTASWESRPEVEEEPALTFRIETPARAGEVRVDVTAALPAPHGFELRVAEPIGKPPVRRSPASPGRRAEPGFLARLNEWAPSVPEAFARAKAEGRRVLAFVQATARADGTTFAGDVLLSTVLADPDVRALVAARFVAVLTGYGGQAWTTGGRSPIPGLGIPVAEAKAPALVVLAADGKPLATLETIGTFDRHLVLDFLRRELPPMAGEEDPEKLLAGGDLAAARKRFAAMGREGRLGLVRSAALAGEHAVVVREAAKLGSPAAAVRRGVALMRLGRLDEAEAVLRSAAAKEGSHLPEALYFLGALLYRAGSREEATRAFERIREEFPGSPFAAPARCRLDWPERTAMYEVLVSVPGAEDARSTERKVAGGSAVERGVDWLLARQDPDGGWPSARTDATRPAICALVAHALLERADEFEGVRAKRLSRALERAVEHLRGVVAGADAATFNSFAAAYILDFQLDRLARDPRAKKAAQKAADLLLGGQCPNGAWSYDRRFALSWKGGFGGWPKTDRGRVHSMNTGPALVYLVRAKEMGLRVPDEALERGKEALLRMKQGPAAFTYTWPDPICWEKEEWNIGRAPVCEQALVLLGGAPERDLERALANFMRHRADLRGPVKLTSGWTMPRGVSSYFYFFACYHAARAIADGGGSKGRKRLAAIRDDLLAVVEADGTWVDYMAIGKAYGTAMALRILDLAE